MNDNRRTSYQIEDFRLKRFHRYGFTHAEHSHVKYEIYYQTFGERIFFVKDRTYHLIKGDLLFISPQDVHRSMNAVKSMYEKVQIEFTPQFLLSCEAAFLDLDVYSPFRQPNKQLRLTESEQEETDSILKMMIRELSDKSDGFNSMIKLLLVQLLQLSTRLFQNKRGVSVLSTRDNDLAMRNVIRYINQYYMNKLTLSHLAELFHFNPSYLSAKFKRSTGFTFVEYVNQVRVKESLKLLSTTDSGMEDIAAQVGYTNATHFGRIFHKTVGIAPSEYRKKKNQYNL